MSVVTKTGDTGKTMLATGKLVPKCDPRVEAYGTLDELMAFIGVLYDTGEWPDDIKSFLMGIQKNLQIIAARFAGCGKVKLADDSVEVLENSIKSFGNPPMTAFEVPGGNLQVSYCNVCRTICRRSERAAVEAGFGGIELMYLNRLSDLFFELGRNGR